MGVVTSKCYTRNYDTPMQLKARIQVLEEDIRQLRAARESEARAYVERKKAFDARERERERERRRHEEEEEEEEAAAVRMRKEGQHWFGNECLVEHMDEERAQREVAVEKWKQLYLTIKTELDNLILRTRQGGQVLFGAEEGMIGALRRELKGKEETIEALRSRLAATEEEGMQREREIDILRQSLRILSNTKKRNISIRKNLRRRFLS